MNMEVLQTTESIELNGVKYCKMVGESGKEWVFINDKKTNKNSVMVRMGDLKEFMKIIGE